MSTPNWCGDVVLVNPPFVARPPHYIAPPIGLLSVAQALTVSAGANVNVVDLALDLREGVLSPSRELIQDSAGKLAAHKADIYGFSVQSHNFPIAVAIARDLKDIRSTVRVVFGGHHVSLFGRSVIDRFPWVDEVVVGSIEAALPTSADGHAFWAPRYEAGPSVKRYILTNDMPVGLVQVGRGCSYRCTFCTIPSVFGRASVHKPVHAVMEEISYLVERGYRYIHLVHDALTTDACYVDELLRAIRTSTLDFAWTAMTRVDLVDPDLLNSLAAAGCRGLLYGVESAATEGLVTVGKKALRSVDLAKILDWNLAAGIAPSFYYLVGIPGETEEGLLSTLLAAARLSILDSGSVSTQLLRLTPGSALWEKVPADFSPVLNTPYARVLTDTLGGESEAVENFISAYPEFCSTFYVPNAPFERSVLGAIDAYVDELHTKLPATMASLVESGIASDLWVTLARTKGALAQGDAVAFVEAYVRDKVPRLFDLVTFERWRRGDAPTNPDGDGVAPMISRVDWSGVTSAAREGSSIIDSLYSSPKRYCPLR